MSPFEAAFQPLSEARDLSQLEAAQVMRLLMDGLSTQDETLTILNAFCDKGVTTTELASFARVMREKAVVLESRIPNLVDTCGTGGGKPTFNISTAAAIVAAGAGASIAKHGNRSTSGLGSADVLESLGLRLGLEPELLLHQLESFGLAFLFAPAHHPAMKHVAGARRALGRRSVFNLLGPLVNPAGAKRQLIGVYDPLLLELMANTTRALGMEKAVLVHSSDGLDEVSPCASTRAIVVDGVSLEDKTFTPEDFGIDALEPEAIRPGGDISECALIVREAISDFQSPRAQAVIPSASVAIWLSGLEPDFRSAGDRAKMSIRNGLAADKLNQLIESGAKI